MKELIKFLVENGLVLFIIFFCLIVLSYGIYQWLNFKKHRIDKFNEAIADVITKIDLKERETTVKVFMEEYANIIGMKKKK